MGAEVRRELIGLLLQPPGSASEFDHFFTEKISTHPTANTLMQNSWDTFISVGGVLICVDLMLLQRLGIRRNGSGVD